MDNLSPSQSPWSEIPESGSTRGSLSEVAKLFLRLGATAFGGPAAHISMMHDEVVKRRKWLSDEQFLDLIGATNLIPGPNSTEMAMHVGHLRAGWRGLILGGLCFLAPAFLIVVGLAWAYVNYGETPQVVWVMYGIKPVVIAIIIQALWNLGRKAVKNWLLAVVGVAAVTLYFVGMNEIAILFFSGLIVMIATNWRRMRGQLASFVILPAGISTAASAGGTAFSLSGMFLTFLKIGTVWYGTGYVLMAFLRADFVERLGWITDQQLIDAIAVGQFTPGPLLTAATFVGYLLDGTTGAIVATAGICLPSFIFVAILNPLIPKIRKSTITGGILDGVNVAALGLMAAVTWQLGHASIVDPLTIIVTAVSLVVLLRYRLNSAWLIAAGAAIGLLRDYLI